MFTKLFCVSNFPFLSRFFSDQDKTHMKKLETLHEKGMKQLKSEMSVEKLIKAIRDMKQILKEQQLFTEETKFKTRNNLKKVIDIDEESEFNSEMIPIINIQS